MPYLQNKKWAVNIRSSAANVNFSRGAYASRLITLANMEQKPGMSLESLSQQHQAQFQARQQELVKNLPNQPLAGCLGAPAQRRHGV